MSSLTIKRFSLVAAAAFLALSATSCKSSGGGGANSTPPSTPTPVVTPSDNAPLTSAVSSIGGGIYNGDGACSGLIKNINCLQRLEFSNDGSSVLTFAPDSTKGIENKYTLLTSASVPKVGLFTRAKCAIPEAGSSDTILEINLNHLSFSGGISYGLGFACYLVSPDLRTLTALGSKAHTLTRGQ